MHWPPSLFPEVVLLTELLYHFECADKVYFKPRPQLTGPAAPRVRFLQLRFRAARVGMPMFGKFDAVFGEP